ncbi:leucyl aminopeptidase, partial [Mycobacterium tuberculosis]
LPFAPGGLSLPPAASLPPLPSALGGAAAVLAPVPLAARLRLPLAVLAPVPMAANMPSAPAPRPGDVLPPS